MEVVHRLPGRCRLRFGPDQAASGRLLAQRLAGQAAVACVRWRPANRSLTVEYLPSIDLDELLRASAAPNLRFANRAPEVANSGLECFAALALAVASGNLAEVILLLLPVLWPPRAAGLP
ncbi:MAG: hypothetical protein M3072_08555 [Candidatus Dormibacteraeota bacterium]|nr:hypothetical protein [Candidatus Dormibacteraeota bacterium]